MRSLLLNILINFEIPIRNPSGHVNKLDILTQKFKGRYRGWRHKFGQRQQIDKI